MKDGRFVEDVDLKRERALQMIIANAEKKKQEANNGSSVKYEGGDEDLGRPAGRSLFSRLCGCLTNQVPYGSIIQEMLPVYIVTVLGMSRLLIYDRSFQILNLFWYCYEIFGFSLPITYMTVVNMMDIGYTPGAGFSFFTTIVLCVCIIVEIELFDRIKSQSRHLNMKRFGDKILQSFINPDDNLENSASLNDGDDKYVNPYEFFLRRFTDKDQVPTIISDELSNETAFDFSEVGLDKRELKRKKKNDARLLRRIKKNGDRRPDTQGTILLQELDKIRLQQGDLKLIIKKDKDSIFGNLTKTEVIRHSLFVES